MIIGEAPGKEEDASGKPWSGPAGQLLDKVWLAAGMNTNDWYISNVAKCRPIAEQGSGKENFTPKKDQIDKCRVYWETEVKLLKPKLIVAAGAVALSTILNTRISITSERGKLSEYKGIPVFPILHTAYLLHIQGDRDKYAQARAWMWEDVQKLKVLVDKLGV